MTLNFVIAVLTLLLVPVAAQCANPTKDDPDTKTLRVFIFAGQSNMEGGDSKVKDIQRFPPFVGLDMPQERRKSPGTDNQYY